LDWFRHGFASISASIAAGRPMRMLKAVHHVDEERANMAQESIAQGDVVVLKSGSHHMTVATVDREKAWLVWGVTTSDGQEKLDTAVVNLVALKKVGSE
jgi:hypothetical protein